MTTFYIDGARTNGEVAAYEVQASDMADAIRQIAAFQAGLAIAGLTFNIERMSTKPTRGVKYVKGW